MVDLVKRAETAQISMVKIATDAQAKGKVFSDEGLSARVVVAIDYSGSMDFDGNRYNDGEVQDTVERVLALSLAGLDDDGDIQVHFFDNQSYPQEEVSEKNYVGFVDKWRRGKRMGGTNYAPVMRDILKDVEGSKKGLFGKKKAASVPTFVLFVTDGAPSDPAETEATLRKSCDLPVFWQFLGLGSGATSYLDHLNNLSGRSTDNTGFTSMVSAKAKSDEEFFSEVLSEFVGDWLPDAVKRGVV